ncbi:MAG: hypothetical protein ACYTG2_08270 [Planctomycetota bacterium]|jgi:hypothetical protein
MDSNPRTVQAERRFVMPEHLRAGLLATTAAGAVIFVAGLFVAPERVWGGFLMGMVWLTMLALAGPVFLAFLTLAGARWSAALQRVPESMFAALPAAALAGLILLFGTHSLYEWSHGALVESDALLQHKSTWLNSQGFALRLVGVFLLWMVLGRGLVEQTRRHAEHGIFGESATRTRTAAVFLAAFALSYSVACFDWLMSLEPHWFSTMFALLHLGGLAATGLAAAILIVLLAERQGALRGVLREEHLHDMGKLLFAFTLFWAYCWYCQYMLIWYTDIPEETGHYLLRKQGPWWLAVQAVLVLKWGVPFLALLSRRACRSRAVLGRVAVVVLAGQALELYVQVGPPLMGADPVFGLWEAGPLLGSLALFFLIALSALARSPAVSLRHPHLPESLSYHTP